MTQSGYFRLVTTVALGMGIIDDKLLFFYYISEESVWTRKSQPNITATGRFMNDSIISLHNILVAHILIYVPLPFMIDPARIKEPVIPQICSKLLSMLLLKIMVVLSTPLLVFHDSFSYLLMIITLPMQ